MLSSGTVSSWRGGREAHRARAEWSTELASRNYFTRLGCGTGRRSWVPCWGRTCAPPTKYFVIGVSSLFLDALFWSFRRSLLTAFGLVFIPLC